jgi:hypothetical protein
MRGRKIECGFECVGFLFLYGRPSFTDPEDYLDFRDMVWSKDTLEHDLVRGVIPPGMLLKAVNGEKIGVVVGKYNTEQRVVLLSEWPMKATNANMEVMG